MKLSPKLRAMLAPLGLLLATACARPPAPSHAARPAPTARLTIVGSSSAEDEEEPAAAPTSRLPTSITSALPAAPTKRRGSPKPRASTNDFAIDLVTDQLGDMHGHTLRISRCAKGSSRANAETRIGLPAAATGIGLSRSGDTIFAAAYLQHDRDAGPTSSRLYALDQRLRIVRDVPLGAPREGAFVSSLSIAADDRYVVTYENDGEGLETATVQLRDAATLDVVAKATVGASRAMGNALRHRLVLTDDDAYVLAPIFPARRVRSTGNKVGFVAEEYVLTRLSLPTLAPVAQALTGRHELGDLPLTLEGSRLLIEDDERIDTFTLDLKTHHTREVPPRNAPPPPPKKACGER